MICPNGHVQKDGNFCRQCGSKLIGDVQILVDRPYEVSGQEPCPGCHYELKRGYQLNCPGCGHALRWI